MSITVNIAHILGKVKWFVEKIMADVSIRVGLDVGGLLANSARGVSAIKEIDRAMDDARKKGNYDLYGKMAYEKDRLQTGISGFQQDIKTFSQSGKFQEYNATIAKGDGVSRFTADHEFMARLKSLDESNKALEQALNGVREAAEKGDFEQIQRGNAAASQELDRVHQAAGQSVSPEAGAGQAEQNALLKYISVEQIAGAMVGIAKTYISQLDRSSIINQQGSGDIVGAEIEELRRSAAMKNSVGSGFGSLIGAGGGALLSLLFPAAAPWLISGGAMLGNKLGGLSGGFDEAEANRMATKEALSKQWESQVPAAMELAGILGRYGGGTGENTRAIRSAFSRVAGAANEYGYSGAEGMEAVKQGASQGLGEGEAIAAAKRTFAFERGTGADRASLLELETRGRRFGMDNMIGAAWQGNQASGMSTGQFNEFLRSMQRVFEDGISKGFIRGGQEIAGNLAYLAELGGGSELYKGEAGAQVMQSLSSGIEGATSLSSVNDIMTYQAAQSVVEKWKNSDDPKERAKYNKLFDLDPNKEGYEAGDPVKASSWYASTLLMNKGFTPEVFTEQMRNFKTAEFGNHDDIIGRIMALYKMNSSQAGFLYNAWQKKGDELNYDDFIKAMERQPAHAPASESVELNFQKMTQSFITEMQKLGQQTFDVKVSNFPDILANMRKDLNGTLSSDSAPLDTSRMTPSEAHAAAQAEFKAALDAKDSARAERATIEIEKASIAMLNPDYGVLDPANIERQIFRAGGAGSGFFSNGFLFKSDEQKEDTVANKKLTGILDSAVKSGDESQIQQATTVMDIFDLVPKDVKKEWDRNNTLNNAFADAKTTGDILAELRKLVTVAEKNGETTVTVRSD